MKHIMLEEKLSSPKFKNAILIAILAALCICIFLLLSPVQSVLASLVSEDTVHMLSLPYAALFVLIFALCCLFAEKTTVFLEKFAHNRLFLPIAGTFLILALVFIGVFSCKYGRQWLDSDHASEMILGKLLAEENSLVSSNWRYSTELRLIYQTLFTMPLFKIFGKFENWALIRAINIVLNNLVLIASYFFMMKQFKIQIKWIFITSFFLIIPLSGEYWNIVTFGGYYIFFIAQAFLCLGLFKILADNNGVSKGNLPVFILFLLLSLALGVQGIRAVYGIFLPLLAACVITRKKPFILTGISGFASSGFGYIINCLLQYKFDFYAYETMLIENTSNFFSKFGQCVVQLISFFGVNSGSPVISAQGVFSIAALIGAIIFFRLVFKSSHNFMSLFFIVSVAVNIFVFIVSDKSVMARFFIPFMVLYIPLAAMCFEYAEIQYSSLKRIAVIFGIILFIFAKGGLSFQNLTVRDANSVRMDYTKYLQDNNLKFGFATFWNANVTTELSNGAIEIAGMELARGQGRLFRFHDYLIKKQFYDPDYHTGESFLLLSRSEWEMLSNRSRPSSRPVPAYEDDHFIVLRYPSAQDIHREFLEPR